jgi:hypothetical protein
MQHDVLRHAETSIEFGITLKNICCITDVIHLIHQKIYIFLSSHYMTWNGDVYRPCPRKVSTADHFII